MGAEGSLIKLTLGDTRGWGSSTVDTFSSSVPRLHSHRPRNDAAVRGWCQHLSLVSALLSPQTLYTFILFTNPDIHSFKLCLEPRAFDKTQKKKELKWGNIQACVSNAFRAFHTLNDWGALSGADSISSERESSSGNSEAVEQSGRLKFLVFMLQCFIPLESHHEYKQNRACTPEAPWCDSFNVSR